MPGRHWTKRGRARADGRLPNCPRLEDYAKQFPELATGQGLSPGLIVEEYRVRQRWRDHPGMAEYAARFPAYCPGLFKRFAEVDAEFTPAWRRAALPGHADRLHNTGSATPWQHREPGRHTQMAVLQQVPGYEILGELGRGGMGVVYKARHLQLNRIVALKMVLAGGHAGSQERSRFLAEAEAVAALQHPNIVQVFDFGQHDGLPYMALEYVNGGSLARPAARRLAEPQEAAWLVEQLARGMAAAHARGIVHRDLKPHNVLLAEFRKRIRNPKRNETRQVRISSLVRISSPR